MKTLISLITTTLMVTNLGAQTFWSNPISQTASWLSTNATHNDLINEIPSTFQLIFQTDDLLEFQNDAFRSSEEILVSYRADSTLHRIRYTSPYQNKYYLIEQLLEQGYMQVGQITDNTFTSLRYIHPTEKIVVHLMSELLHDVVILTKETMGLENNLP